MAQPNVAREPSMEEILASIRRIIESNEPQAERTVPTSMPPVYAEDEIDDGDIDIVTEMAANDRGEPQRAGAERMANTDHAPERSLSLADVAARVRAASARQVESEERLAPPAPAAAQFPRDNVMAGALRPQATQVAEASPGPAATSSNEIPPAQPSASLAAEPAYEPVREQIGDHPAADVPASLPARMEALISEEAGAQVARSFHDLAAVFDGINNRSIDDMAQEMLRPMLQEWLDDNLPTLVERLVREEIERVARGSRR